MKFISTVNVKKMIESAVAEHDQATQDTLQGYMDNEQQLLEQIEELKAKLPQPVEISRDLADAIDYLKELRFEWWHSILLSPTKDNDYQFLDKKYAELLSSTSYSTRLAIIKNGYTIKPEPTLEEKILNTLEKPFITNKCVLEEIMSILKNEGMLKDEEA